MAVSSALGTDLIEFLDGKGMSLIKGLKGGTLNSICFDKQKFEKVQSDRIRENLGF